jgi:hypothetical protein
VGGNLAIQICTRSGRGTTTVGAGEVMRTEENRPLRLDSVITCPVCGTARTETMPTDAAGFYTMHRLRRAAAPRDRRLLFVRFLRLGSVPARPAGMVGE